MLSRGEAWPAGDALPNATQDAAGLLCCNVTLLPHSLSCCPPRPQGFSRQRSLPVSQPSACTGAGGCSLPRCRTLYFPLLNCMRFLSAHFSSLSEVPLDGNTLIWSTIPPGFGEGGFSTTNLLRVHCTPSSRSLMLNSINHSCISHSTATLEKSIFVKYIESVCAIINFSLIIVQLLQKEWHIECDKSAFNLTSIQKKWN